MLSQKARYALRALGYLAAEGEARTVQDIADGARVPKKFLELILLDLKTRGIVASRRGRTGGYALARPAGAISYAEVIRAIDGPLALAPCASRTAYRACEDCEDVETCEIRAVLLAARDATAKILETRKISRPRGRRKP